MVLEALEPDEGEELPRAVPLLGLGKPRAHDLQGEHDVPLDGAPFEQDGVLERHADGAARRAHELAAQAHLARIGSHQAGD